MGDGFRSGRVERSLPYGESGRGAVAGRGSRMCKVPEVGRSLTRSGGEREAGVA